jgi:hypothetical protein
MADPRRVARLLAAACAIAAALAAPASAAAAQPPIRHVFVIVLENKNWQETFGFYSKAPYLARTLPAQGELLPNYYATGHLSLDNYISMVSGQAPNSVTQSDALMYVDFAPAAPAPDGQYVGQGAVYPPQVKTIANQLAARGLSWKGYMEDMGNSATEPKTCRHPALNSQDGTQSARNGDQYAARHNPFVYFHSIIDTPACAANDVPLDRLPGDLQSAATTPNYAFITPNLCHDGHDAPCVNGEPGGLVSIDAFLRRWVPLITGSPAFRQDGLLVVTFDEAEAQGGSGDSSACCNEQPGPNTPDPGGPTPGPGGGRIGAVLLSQYVRPGSITTTPYNHYSLLRSVEDLFGLAHLGYAGQAGLKAFGDDIYNATPAAAAPATTPGAARLNVRVTGVPRRCARRRFTATVRSRNARLRRVVVLLDGRRISSSRRATLRVHVDPRRLRRGRHRLSAYATALNGRRAHATARFRRC